MTLFDSGVGNDVNSSDWAGYAMFVFCDSSAVSVVETVTLVSIFGSISTVLEICSVVVEVCVCFCSFFDEPSTGTSFKSVPSPESS